MRRRSKHNMPKLLALAGALALCIGGLIFAALQAYGARTPDKMGCFSDLSQLQTILFVDASEPRWNEEQRRSLRHYFDELYNSLAFNERLSFYTTEGDVISDIMPPRFHICGQARTAAELEAVNAQGGTAGYLQKQHERLYKHVFAPQLDGLLSLKPDEARRQSSQSPVLEQVKSLSRKLKLGSRLILASDLIQNSDSAQFCRVQNDMPPFADFKKRRVYLSRLKPEPLEGVAVEVLMLQRAGYGQTGLGFCRDEEELRDFWRDYFLDNGAASVRFIRIRHGYTAG